MSDREIKLKEIFKEMNALVDKILALESEEQGVQYFSSSHILIIGCENIDEDNDIVGSVAAYPKDGSQAYWKIKGLLHTAISLQDQRQND